MTTTITKPETLSEAIHAEPKTVSEAIQQLESVQEPIEKYLWLRNLGYSNPDLYYKLLFQQAQEVLPFIYTPTVGEACQKYHVLPIEPHGLYIGYNDKGRILEKLQSCGQDDVKVIVVTDGERILGLGDLGANGMGISEGKITLYTVAAGVAAACCMPMALDVGTNNQALLDDPNYKGLRQHRPDPAEYDEFILEFVTALNTWQPHVLLQWEDFANKNAFRILEAYHDKICCFNDDIQGTACITLAAMLSALRVQTDHPADEWTVMFHGAGEAGVGIAELIAYYSVHRHKEPLEEARKRCVFVDSKGMVCKGRHDLQEHKKPYAHDLPCQPDLKSALRAVRPQVLIGVSTVHGAFDKEVVELMCEWNERPIIMPLSNPTSKSECTFEQAFEWSKGKVLFASGSAFDPIKFPEGNYYSPAQANNAYIFPAIGHAAVITQCRSITQEIFLVAAEALSGLTTLEAAASKGELFPPFHDILIISNEIMAAVCPYMVQCGLGQVPEDKPKDMSWKEYCKGRMWTPEIESKGPKGVTVNA